MLRSQISLEPQQPRFTPEGKGPRPDNSVRRWIDGIDAERQIEESKTKMRILQNSAAVLVFLTANAMLIFAQWPNYPTPGPRAKDGKIDFAAPPPRTAEGKPDFSGLWEPARGPGGRGGQSMNGTLPCLFRFRLRPTILPSHNFSTSARASRRAFP